MTTLLLSATDVAISLARESGTLKVVERVSERLGNTFWSIEDQHGTIEVHLSHAEAAERAGEAV